MGGYRAIKTSTTARFGGEDKRKILGVGKPSEFDQLRNGGLEPA